MNDVLFYQNGKTINIFQNSGGDWEYDTYNGTLSLDELDCDLLSESVEGGICTGSFIDAMEMAGVDYK